MKGEFNMTKKSVETFTAYLDIMQGDPIYANASRALGLHEASIFRWLKRSRVDAEHPEQPSEFCFEYAGETKFFHQHMRDCITASVERIEQAARSRAEHGHYSVSMFQGRTVYKSNPDYEDTEIRELLGITDPWLRDANGDRIPELIWHAPSTDLVAMILQAHSKKYRKQSQVNVDVNNRHSGGVMIVGGSQPKTIAQKTPLPVLEIIRDEIEQERPLTGDNEPEQIEGSDGEQQAPETEPVAEQPTLTAPRPVTSHGPLSPLQRDLLARAAMASNDPNRAAPTKPYQRDGDDYSKARTGPGHVPAGGVKVS
jgi:hypothetical protein